MKSIIFCLLLLLTIAIAGRAQNGGITHTNQYVSITNFGYQDDHYLIKIDNLRDCPSEFKITIRGQQTTVGPIAAKSSQLYQVEAMRDCEVKIQCKPLDKCVPTGPDMGYVEAKCGEGPDIIPLPLKFTKFLMRKKNINEK